MIEVRLAAILAIATACTGLEIFPSEGPNGPYSMDYWDALRHCASLGAHLATRAELEELRKANYSNCQCGWTLDKTAHFPMTHSSPGCGGGPGLHQCNWGHNRWDAYCIRGDPIGRCSKPLGIETGDIRPSQMYASSEFHSWFPVFQNSKWSASIARIHNRDLTNAWIPLTNGRNQYIEVDLEEPKAVTGLVTQGASRLGKPMWVTKYLIAYGKDGHNFKKIDKIFTGNTNNNGLKRNMFPEPVLARYIRVIPYDYHYRVALRLELLGCDLQTYQSGISTGRKEVAVNGDPFREYPPEDAE